MLQRPTIRAIYRTLSLHPQDVCKACVCSCGGALPPQSRANIQRRFYEPRPNLTSSYGQSLRTRQEKEQQVEVIQSRRQYVLQWLKENNYLHVQPLEALRFLDDFTALPKPKDRKSGHGRRDKDPEAMNQLVNKYGLRGDECFWIGIYLHREYELENKALAKSVLYTLARAGNMPATYHIIRNTLLAARQGPELLNSPEIAHIRQQLTKFSESYIHSDNEPFAFSYLVLEGKVAARLGQTQRAIDLWTKAMPAAIKLAQSDIKPESLDSNTIASSTPWIELGNACLAINNFKKARYAIEIGCMLDDPYSHYLAALLEKRTTAVGDHVTTSGWLYHMLKAAGAGHPQAAHALGNWYGTSVWKYVENEPPDDTKPTPFDSYPPDFTPADTAALQKTELQKQWGNVFFSAGFPSTAEGRVTMAMQWLEVSMDMLYAPSYLVAAQLCLQKMLWSDAAVPKECLELSDSRYEYASKTEYDDDMRIDRAKVVPKQDIPNPKYDPERAKEYLEQVFYAAQAFSMFRKKSKDWDRAISRKESLRENFDQDEILQEYSTLPDWPQRIRKWFRYAEHREMYTDEVKGILWDHELGVDLVAAAKGICDEHEFTIYDDQGGLVYRHKTKPRV